MSISRALKISQNTDFPPSKLGTAFKKWELNGLVMFDQLFDGEVLMSYEQLRQKYNLPAHDFYFIFFFGFFPTETLFTETQRMGQTMHIAL